MAHDILQQHRRILSVHPTDTFTSQDDEDASIIKLELRDPHALPLDELIQLVGAIDRKKNPAVWGYLYGIWESRELVKSVMGHGLSHASSTPQMSSGN